MKQISINNGSSFVKPVEAIKNIDWDVIVNAMDDEIRESVHFDIAPCTDLEFLEEYLKKANEDLIIG